MSTWGSLGDGFIVVRTGGAPSVDWVGAKDALPENDPSPVAAVLRGSDPKAPGTGGLGGKARSPECCGRFCALFDILLGEGSLPPLSSGTFCDWMGSVFSLSDTGATSHRWIPGT